MLMLVASNNFALSGWEAVGPCPTWIGWFTRPRRLRESRPFSANRVGDFGFILGVGPVPAHFGTLDYAAVRRTRPRRQDGEPVGHRGVVADDRHHLCPFVGAMGAGTAYVWLPTDGGPDADSH
jgi:NADH-quinone oxidoreductase subunit L